MLAIASPAWADERVESVTSFDRVRVEGPYRVEIVTGRGPSARLSGTRQALDRVTLSQQGQSLFIRANRTGWTGGWPGEDKSGPVTIRLTAGELKSVGLAGSPDVSVNLLRGPRVQLTVEGSGRLSVDRVDADQLGLAVIGSGSFHGAGTVRSLSVNAQGTGSIDAAGLIANDLIVTSQSGGEIGLGAKTSAKVRSSGAGDVRIGGKPACAVTALGSGQVYCGAEKK